MTLGADGAQQFVNLQPDFDWDDFLAVATDAEAALQKENAGAAGPLKKKGRQA